MVLCATFGSSKDYNSSIARYAASARAIFHLAKGRNRRGKLARNGERERASVLVCHRSRQRSLLRPFRTCDDTAPIASGGLTGTGPDRLKEPPGTRSISSRMAIAEAGGASTARVDRARRALDALNFFLADVRGGLGPYLAIYLLSVRNWNEAEIGIVMSISAIAGILAETPGGALIDAIRAKRTVVALAALVVTAGSLLLPFLSTFLAVALSQATVSAVGSIFGPAIAAISLGIVGHAHFARRTGRNEALRADSGHVEA